VTISHGLPGRRRLPGPPPAGAARLVAWGRPEAHGLLPAPLTGAGTPSCCRRDARPERPMPLATQAACGAVPEKRGGIIVWPPRRARNLAS